MEANTIKEVIGKHKNGYNNIPDSVLQKVGRNLHRRPDHPIGIMVKWILKYFTEVQKSYTFQVFTDLPPLVAVAENFDKLLIPESHPSRRKSDTYYVNEKKILRTHTSAHQNEMLAKGIYNFIAVGDVYRKDEINATHYPVFHQVEVIAKVDDNKSAKDELIRLLNGFVEYAFPGCKYRVNPDYFPFTEPSFEYEVEFRGKWLEILGCGVMHKKIVENNGIKGQFLALGMGIERLAMLFFDIPDIRYFWTEDPRFLEQFKSGEIVKFKPYTRMPSVTKDISFWIPKGRIGKEMVTVEEKDGGGKKEKVIWKDENDFFDIIRNVCGEDIEKMEFFDEFYAEKKDQYSWAYHITYSPHDTKLSDPSEFNTLCNSHQEQLVKEVVAKLGLVVR